MVLINNKTIYHLTHTHANLHSGQIPLTEDYNDPGHGAFHE